MLDASDASFQGLGRDPFGSFSSALGLPGRSSLGAQAFVSGRPTAKKRRASASSCNLRRRRASSVPQKPAAAANVSTSSADGGRTQDGESAAIGRALRKAEQLAVHRPNDALAVLSRVVSDGEKRPWPQHSDAQRAAVAACVNCANLLLRDSQYLRATKLYTRALNAVARLPGCACWRHSQGLLMHSAAVALAMHGDHGAAARWLRNIPAIESLPFSVLLLRHLEQRTLSPDTVPATAMLGSLVSFKEDSVMVPAAQRARLPPQPVPPPPRKTPAQQWARSQQQRSGSEPVPPLPRVRPATARQRPTQDGASGPRQPPLPPQAPPRPHTTAALARAAGSATKWTEEVKPWAQCRNASVTEDELAEVIDDDGDDDGDTPDCWESGPAALRLTGPSIRPTTAPRRRPSGGAATSVHARPQRSRPLTAGAARTALQVGCVVPVKQLHQREHSPPPSPPLSPPPPPRKGPPLTTPSPPPSTPTPTLFAVPPHINTVVVKPAPPSAPTPAASSTPPAPPPPPATPASPSAPRPQPVPPRPASVERWAEGAGGLYGARSFTEDQAALAARWKDAAAALQGTGVVRVRRTVTDADGIHILHDTPASAAPLDAVAAAGGLTFLSVERLAKRLLAVAARAHERGWLLGASLCPDRVIVADCKPSPDVVGGAMVADLLAVGPRSALVPPPPPPFRAPEMGDEASCTPAADVWAVGAVVEWCARAGEVAGALEPIAPLLRRLCASDPTDRPSALDALATAELWASPPPTTPAAPRAATLALVDGYLSQLTRDRLEYHVTVRRTEVVHDLVEALARIECEDLLSPFSVAFVGEAAVDFGGVSNELFAEFVRAVLSPADPDHGSPAKQSLFEASEGTGGCASHLPSPGASAVVLETLGKVLLKCFADRRSLWLPLPPIFFKFLLGDEYLPATAEEWLADYAEFDAAAAAALSATRRTARVYRLGRRPGRGSDCKAASAAEVRAEGERWLESLMLEFPGADNRQLQLANIDEFVSAQCRHRLIECRLAELAAVRTGFTCCAEAAACVFPSLTPSELRLLLRGGDALSGEAVVANIEFRNWEQSDSSPYYLCSQLRELSQDALRRFLRLCTGLCALPHTGLSKRIAVFKGDRLYAHTCFNQLTLPEYSTMQDLGDAMNAALATVDVAPAMEDDEDFD